MAKVFNILFTQSAGYAGHVASVIGAGLGLEVFQSLDHVIEVLTRDFGDFVLTHKLTQMAHGAQSFIGFGQAQLGFVRISFKPFVAEFLLGKIVGQQFKVQLHQ